MPLPLAPPPRGFDRSAWPRLSDPQWFALTWYGQTIAALCHAYHLRRLTPELPVPNRVGRLPGFATGHLVAVTEGVLAAETREPEALAGGPCIGDCQSYPTLEALYDTVQVLLASRTLGVPAVIFVGDAEEALERGHQRTWEDLGLRFERWILALAEALAVREARVARTSSAVHREALDRAGGPARGLAPERIDGAFHLGFEAPRPLLEGPRNVTCRVIEAHLPEVIGAHLGRAAPPLVWVLENLQQTCAADLAREIAAARGQEVELLLHWPAPALSASERMYRAGAWDKAPAWELEAVAEGSLAGVHPYTTEFFRCWLGADERARLAAVARRAWG